MTTSRRRHAVWIVALGLVLGVLLYVGYLAIGALP
jgi:threonine/homoserine/homoserine lactone efflux protein